MSPDMKLALAFSLCLFSFPVTVLSQEPATLKGFESAISKLRSQAKSALQRIESEAEIKRKEVELTFVKEAESIRKNVVSKMDKSQFALLRQKDLDGALKSREDKKKIEDMSLVLVEQTKPATEAKTSPAKNKDSKDGNRQLNRHLNKQPVFQQKVFGVQMSRSVQECLMYIASTVHIAHH